MNDASSFPPDTPLLDLPLAALDFETTGLSAARGDRVIEVAVVRGRPGEVPTSWHTLLDPGRLVAATHIHGITDEMLRGRPPFSAVIDELHTWLDGAVLVAHNASFDLAFLEMECTLAGRRAPRPPVVDTLGLARRVLASGDHRLSTLCDRFGLARARAHRALDDARATWELAHRLVRVADTTGRLTLEHVQLLCRRRTPAELDALLAQLDGARRRGAPIVVDYLSGEFPDRPATRRTITVQRLSRSRVAAFCHLRDADRTFRVDRLRLVEELPTPPRAG